jgi:hypothetical protein
MQRRWAKAWSITVHQYTLVLENKSYKTCSISFIMLNIATLQNDAENATFQNDSLSDWQFEKCDWKKMWLFWFQFFWYSSHLSNDWD